MTSAKANLPPFIGPRPFERTEQDRQRFYGRDEESLEIVSLILSHPIVVIYAQSGAGKTSLFNAMVGPELEGRQFEVLPLARVGGGLPENIDLHRLPNPYVLNALLSLQPKVDPQLLQNLSFSDFLRDWPQDNEKNRMNSPRALIFDQFEELFVIYTSNWRDQQRHFFEQLASAVEKDRLLRIVLVLREDFLAHLDPFASLLPERLTTRFRLERLRRAQALAAISTPLENVGCCFAEGVAEQLVEDLLKIRLETPTGQTIEVVGEFVEPVQLQVVCQQLWQNRTPNMSQITLGNLTELANVDKALAHYYVEALRKASRETDIHVHDLRQWCDRYLITETGTRSFVHRGIETTQGLPNQAVIVLENLHLVRAESRAGGTWYELAHDRFVGPIAASNKQWYRDRDEMLEKISRLFQSARQGIEKQNYNQASADSTQAGSLSEQVAYRWGLVVARIFAGDIFALQGHSNDAVAAYSKALLLKNVIDERTLKYLLTRLADLAFADENYAGSIRFSSDYIELFPDDPEGYSCRGAAWWYSGKCDEAINDYTEALRRDPNSAAFYNGRGQAYAESGQYEAALTDLNRAIRLADENSRLEAYARNGRALALGGLREFERALEDFERSIHLCSNNAWVYFNRALTYEGWGRYDKAAADYQASLEKKDPPLTPLKREKASERLRALRSDAA